MTIANKHETRTLLRRGELERLLRRYTYKVTFQVTHYP